MSNTPASTAGQPSLWRNIISIHPAALKYPRMPAQEFANFSDDIKVNSIKVAIVFYIDRDGHKSLLDGVHRLDGAERAGVLVVDNGKLRLQTQYGLRDVPQEIVAWPVDPYAYAASLNAHRRHLTPEEKRERIAEALKADPSKSDRAIAETVKASPTTVGKVRANVQAGHNSHRNEKTGRKARGRQPGKVKPKPKLDQDNKPEDDVQASADARKAEAAAIEEPEPGSPAEAAAVIRQALDDATRAADQLVERGRAAGFLLSLARSRLFETDEAFNAWVGENGLGRDKLPAMLAIGKHPDLARSIMVFIDEMLFEAFKRAKEATAIDDTPAPAPAVPIADPGPLPAFLDRSAS
jgi:hypothetical protein